MKKSRSAPITSTLIGFPLAAILAMFLYGGFVLSDQGIGFVVGIPMVLLAVLFLPAWTALGFVSVGRTVAVRAGSDKLWLAVIIGSGVSALLPLSMPVMIVGIGLASALGVGAGSRTLFQMATGGLAEERVKPPSSQV
ncbi:MAG: hypothetical protein U5K37_05735 [Natrialbaceae archaeon]|nr:hypothetical protein [Natrialbaceae archaeon]